jgi:peptidoglycan endopeptidase LytE
VPGGAPARAPGHASEGGEGYAIAGTALSFRGAPYRTAGSGPSGFDCSGLVWYVFGQHGIQVPRTVAQQYHVGSRIDTRDLRAGDLVFFNTTGAGPSHVGISIGGDEFVHAPAGSGQVRVERLGAAYWKDRFVGARRIT